MDHDHSTGHIRGTLHKDCNILLGKIENYINGMGKVLTGQNRLEQFLQQAYSYMNTSYDDMPIYHAHKTATEKKQLAAKRRKRKARLKKCR